ncbi:GFA family protein [Leisingera sp. ANG-M6]|uniref:GFA family protein n=1 Tax=Leisingera sp. ANG-M6 TaxID=1577900 RepID=UPI0009E3BA55|nr:GFA family protein [Leisingera sp. ANG-M6]
MHGRCLCGSVTFNVELPVLSVVNCHCESCRRQCSAPMTTYIGVTDGQWQWTGEEPKLFRSSPGVERTFCGTCGSPMSFRSQAMSGTMHFYVAAMADPEAFTPALHVAHEEKLCWFNSDDGLLKRTGPEYL